MKDRGKVGVRVNGRLESTGKCQSSGVTEVDFLRNCNWVASSGRAGYMPSAPKGAVLACAADAQCSWLYVARLLMREYKYTIHKGSHNYRRKRIMMYPELSSSLPSPALAHLVAILIWIIPPHPLPSLPFLLLFLIFIHIVYIHVSSSTSTRSSVILTARP